MQAIVKRGADGCVGFDFFKLAENANGPYIISSISPKVQTSNFRQMIKAYKMASLF